MWGPCITPPCPSFGASKSLDGATLQGWGWVGKAHGQLSSIFGALAPLILSLSSCASYKPVPITLTPLTSSNFSFSPDFYATTTLSKFVVGIPQHHHRMLGGGPSSFFTDRASVLGNSQFKMRALVFKTLPFSGKLNVPERLAQGLILPKRH